MNGKPGVVLSFFMLSLALVGMISLAPGLLTRRTTQAKADVPVFASANWKDREVYGSIIFRRVMENGSERYHLSYFLLRQPSGELMAKGEGTLNSSDFIRSGSNRLDIRIDTRHSPSFRTVKGPKGIIEFKWSAQEEGTDATSRQSAAVQGRVMKWGVGGRRSGSLEFLNTNP